jgi:hypothetical protein
VLDSAPTTSTRLKGGQFTFDERYLHWFRTERGSFAAGRLHTREDYWGLVGRFVMRWPQRLEGIRLRSGLKIGYAPGAPAAEAINIEEDTDGLARDVGVSVMDFLPGDGIDVSYAPTGGGWYLSPQFRPAKELLELRYQWRPAHFPLVEIRIREREDVEQETTASRKRHEIDGYIRLTWEFNLLSRRSIAIIQRRRPRMALSFGCSLWCVRHTQDRLSAWSTGTIAILPEQTDKKSEPETQENSHEVSQIDPVQGIRCVAPDTIVGAGAQGNHRTAYRAGRAYRGHVPERIIRTSQPAGAARHRIDRVGVIHHRLAHSIRLVKPDR